MLCIEIVAGPAAAVTWNHSPPWLFMATTFIRTRNGIQFNGQERHQTRWHRQHMSLASFRSIPISILSLNRPDWLTDWVTRQDRIEPVNINWSNQSALWDCRSLLFSSKQLLTSCRSCMSFKTLAQQGSAWNYNKLMYRSSSVQCQCHKSNTISKQNLLLFNM